MQKTTIYRKPVGENLFEEEISFFLMAVIRKTICKTVSIKLL